MKEDWQKIQSNSSELLSAVEGISVELWSFHDSDIEARKVASFYRSTWGDLISPWDWENLYDPMYDAQMVAEGRALPNCLEAVELTFGISGISRATTHQLVRSRVGAVFGQQGGRDNDWRNFNLRFPQSYPEQYRSKVLEIQDTLNELYKELVSLGVPYQDARYVLPMGLTTNLVAGYNLLSLKGTLQRRLCNRMMWETNYVARLMHDLVVEALPWVGRSLRSGCESRGVCASVSPMFPAACAYKGERAKDNTTLLEMIESKGYDFPAEANGCNDFTKIDLMRTRQEAADDSLCLSLVDGRILATKSSDGIWEGYRG